MTEVLQAPIYFEGLPESQTHIQKYFYRKLGFRAPKKGEWYLSGAIVTGYRAPNDFPETTKYWVIEPVAKAVPKTIFIASPLRGATK